jgi:hypothetical protein
MQSVDSRAFLSGFLDSFGGVGDVFKTRIQSEEVLRESKKPTRRSGKVKVRISSLPLNKSVRLWTKAK